MSSDPARDFLRSTSMPTQPLIDDVAPSSSPLDTQLLELFFDRVPMGVAVFDTDMRLQRCNKTWTAFYEHYLGVPAEYTAPGRHLNDLIPGNEEAVQLLVDTALSGRVIRQAAHRIAIPGTETYWDVVFAPLFGDGRVIGVVDIVTDATDRVLSFQRLEARIAMFSQVAAGMSVDQPLSTTLSQVVDAVRSTSDAVACSIVCWEEDWSRPATAYADDVLGDGFAEALEGCGASAGCARSTSRSTTAPSLESFRDGPWPTRRSHRSIPSSSRTRPGRTWCCSRWWPPGSWSGRSRSTSRPARTSTTTTAATCLLSPTRPLWPSATARSTAPPSRRPRSRSGTGSRASCTTR